MRYSGVLALSVVIHAMTSVPGAQAAMVIQIRQTNASSKIAMLVFSKV